MMPLTHLVRERARLLRPVAAMYLTFSASVSERLASMDSLITALRSPAAIMRRHISIIVPLVHGTRIAAKEINRFHLESAPVLVSPISALPWTIEGNTDAGRA